MRPTRSGLNRCAGFSLSEVTIILTTLTVMSGLAAPAIGDYVAQAQVVRARHDVRTLAVCLIQLFGDTASERRIEGGWATQDLLVGAGAIPGAGERESIPWTAPVGGTVGLLDDQLIRNTAGYTPYRASGWRGSYLQDPVGPDPWGNRYAINVRALRSRHADTVVLSAGPDGLVHSLFEVDGLPTRGDDIGALVASTGTGADVPP